MTEKQAGIFCIVVSTALLAITLYNLMTGNTTFNFTNLSCIALSYITYGGGWVLIEKGKQNEKSE